MLLRSLPGEALVLSTRAMPTDPSEVPVVTATTWAMATGQETPMVTTCRTRTPSALATVAMATVLDLPTPRLMLITISTVMTLFSQRRRPTGPLFQQMLTLCSYSSRLSLMMPTLLVRPTSTLSCREERTDLLTSMRTTSSRLRHHSSFNSTCSRKSLRILLRPRPMQVRMPPPPSLI